MASLPANNSSERLAKAQQEKVLNNPVAIGNDSVTALSSSEQLANDLAAVKIADSKENLAEVAKSESKASLNDLASKNCSKGSLNNLTKNNNSRGSINDLAKNRSNVSLNKSEASIPKMSQSNTEIAADTAESVKEEAKKSTDELVAVSLNEKSEEVADEKSPAEPVVAETSTPAPAAETKTENTTASEENAAAVQTEANEEGKKSCLAQKAAKCRCIIS